jgi:flagellar basal-body rod modification protein FlgD
MSISSIAASQSSAQTVANSTANSASLAQNFTAFLTLLTTQLKNQNPLEPLDTNQFTQQLVQFAQVEQQMNMNASLTTMIDAQKTMQTSAAMSFLGTTVRVAGDTAKLEAGSTATWTYTSAKAATATINIKNAAGSVVYTSNLTVGAGQQQVIWDGRDNNGTTMPAGDYKISITAKDASGQTVAVSTEVEGVVDGIDVTKSPPLLSIGAQTFTIDQVKSVRRS